MKIGYDAKRAFNNHRGLGNYSRDTIRIMSSFFPQIEFDLFTPYTDPDIDFPCPGNATLVQPKRALSPSVWRTFGITQEIRKRGLDLYHGLSHELPYGIENTGIPSVVTMHDLIFLRHPELFPAVDRNLYKIKYLHSCKVATRIIAVSNQTKEDLIELAGIPEEKIEVVYQGCHPQFLKIVSEEQKQSFREAHQLPKEYLLNVAAMEPRKNQLRILEALAKGQIDFPLVLAGRQTEYLDELRQYVEKQHLQNKVFFLPDLSFNDLPALYQGASLFVFPSQYEGFGIPIVEALQSGVPVIASKGGCMEESGGPDSCYVDPEDPEELAEQIKRLLSDPEIRGQMLRQGKTYAQRFNDEHISNSIMNIYKSL